MKEKVLNYLKYINRDVTPTQIGIALGYDYNKASSSVSYSLKKLCEEGLIKRYKMDSQILYRINKTK